MSAVGLTLMVCHILIEIALRNFFDSSTYVLDEFIGYATAGITFNTLGFAFERGVLIRVSLIFSALTRHPRATALLENAAVFLTLSVIGLVVFYFWGSVLRSLERGAVSETVAEVPLWIPESIMLFGLFAFWMVLAARFLCFLSGISMADIDANGRRWLRVGIHQA